MTFSPSRRALCAAAALLPLAPCVPDAAAQGGNPGKPIHWIVAYPAGGGSDFLARNLAPQLGRQLGQTIVIENKPGAAGIIGTDATAKSAPDGYTILTGDNGAMVFNPAMYKKLPYDRKDFAPLGFMARFPLILAVYPGSGFTSAKQLLDEVKRNPGKYSYASPGTGSPHHLAMELLKDRTGSFIVHVPYRGTALAIQDVMAGQVPMMIVDIAGGLSQIRSGKIRALAVLSPKRIASLPDVPTLDEIGLKGFDVTAWQGLFVPKGTPADIAGRLSAEMQKAIVVPEVKSKLEDFGLEVAPSDGPTLARFIERETVFWHKLIRERHLSAE
ncbi:MAG TPA: tripartite tricarboxylate transporter substrate binding protein [Burkholderiaceae bacterium]|nr:tripartite tricarboxylate transporter substrate binding protein [Burkholderiaceae bacterium]